MATKEPVHVVGAVIVNEQGGVLCARRGSGMSLPGLWEFPGGKQEAGETPEEALVREIREELGVRIRVGERIEETEFEYPHGPILLQTYRAYVEEGIPASREHAELRWLPAGELYRLDWAPADVPTVRALLDEDASI